MPITFTDGTTTFTNLKLNALMRRKKWRMINIPLMNNSPFCFDLGLEMYEVEITCWLWTIVDMTKFDALVSPVQVTASTYSQIPVGWYRIEQNRIERKGGQVHHGIGTMTMIRDYYHAC